MNTKNIFKQLNSIVNFNNLSDDRIIELSELCNKQIIKTQKEYLKIYKEKVNNPKKKSSN